MSPAVSPYGPGGPFFPGAGEYYYAAAARPQQPQLAVLGGRGPGRVVTGPQPGEKRPPPTSYLGPAALGVPGTPGTGALLKQHQYGPAPTAQRTDLGSVPVTTAGFGVGAGGDGAAPGGGGGFIGSLTNMFFGRKGGFVN